MIKYCGLDEEWYEICDHVRWLKRLKGDILFCGNFDDVLWCCDLIKTMYNSIKFGVILNGCKYQY